MKLELSCGATVEIESVDNGAGFYLTIKQKCEDTWLTTEETAQPKWDKHYIKAYMSSRTDLADAFRAVADFIDANPRKYQSNYSMLKGE